MLPNNDSCRAASMPALSTKRDVGRTASSCKQASSWVFLLIWRDCRRCCIRSFRARKKGNTDPQGCVGKYVVTWRMPREGGPERSSRAWRACTGSEPRETRKSWGGALRLAVVSGYSKCPVGDVGQIRLLADHLRARARRSEKGLPRDDGPSPGRRSLRPRNLAIVLYD